MSEIKVNRLDQLSAKLKKNMNMNVVKTVVKKNGAELQKKAQKNAEFKGHYEWVKGKGLQFVNPTGELKRSIGLSSRDNGMTAAVGPTKDYGEYVEYGTRFMEAQPYIKPALDEQKRIFKNDLEKVMK